MSIHCLLYIQFLIPGILTFLVYVMFIVNPIPGCEHQDEISHLILRSLRFFHKLLFSFYQPFVTGNTQ